MTDRKMHLGLFLLPAGHHLTAWRQPGNSSSATDFAQIKALAQTAERGLMDAIFLADVDGLWGSKLEAMAKDPGTLFLEPFTLLSALAAVTERIGLIASASTTYNPPFHVARKFASLDHISGGRAAWNIVTSFMPHIARNFGTEDFPAHGDRYAAVGEYVQVVRALWDSWGDDAVVRDQSAGRYLDLVALNIPNHAGEHYTVAGPLNLPRPPQGHPVLVQAGSSEEGRELAAGVAEIIFTVQSTIEDARAFRTDIHDRASRLGRNIETIKVMPGAFVVMGRSRADAEERFAAMQADVDPANGLAALANYGFPVDLNKHPYDAPFPDLPATDGQKGRREVVLEMVLREKMTVGDVCRRMAVTRGHSFILGDAEEVADHLCRWFGDQAADGFNLMFAEFPFDLDLFVEGVIPILQHRGVYRTEYGGKTLRDHLGLSRP